MLAPSKKALDAAGMTYTAHTLVGPIAESIIDQAKRSGSNMIYMGTRGMTALEYGVRIGCYQGSAPGAHSCRADPLRPVNTRTRRPPHRRLI